MPRRKKLTQPAQGQEADQGEPCELCRTRTPWRRAVHEWLGRVKVTRQLCVGCADARTTFFEDVDRAPNRQQRRARDQQWTRERHHALRWVLTPAPEVSALRYVKPGTHHVGSRGWSGQKKVA